jgi:hypothetical protein
MPHNMRPSLAEEDGATGRASGRCGRSPFALDDASLAGLLDHYYTRHHFVLRVAESALFGGWDYAVTADRGAAEVRLQAPTLVDAWIAAERLVQRLIEMKGKALM